MGIHGAIKLERYHKRSRDTTSRGYVFPGILFPREALQGDVDSVLTLMALRSFSTGMCIFGRKMRNRESKSGLTDRN